MAGGLEIGTIQLTTDDALIAQWVAKSDEIMNRLKAKAEEKKPSVDAHIKEHAHGHLNSSQCAVKCDRIAKAGGWPVALIHPTNSIAYHIWKKHPPSW